MYYYIILQKAKPYTRTRQGRLEHVSGYPRTIVRDEEQIKENYLSGNLEYESAVRAVSKIYNRNLAEGIVRRWKEKEPYVPRVYSKGILGDRIGTPAERLAHREREAREFRRME